MALKFKATVVDNIDCSQLILGKSIVERLEIYSESEEYIILRRWRWNGRKNKSLISWREPQ